VEISRFLGYPPNMGGNIEIIIDQMFPMSFPIVAFENMLRNS